MGKMKESFIFYKSFYEAIECLPENEQIKAYRAIMEYSLNGGEPQIEGSAKAVFTLVKPQIDANNRRFENGCKGGRRAESTESTEITERTETKPNVNQNITKAKSNVNVNPNVNLNNNSNEYDNNNSNVNSGESEKSESSAVTVTTVFTPRDKISFTDKQLEEFERQYPDVDILKDIEKIQNEIDNMPKCNLYGKNLESFIVRWFERTQMTGGNKRSRNPPPVKNMNTTFDADLFLEKAIKKSMKLGEYAEGLLG